MKGFTLIEVVVTVAVTLMVTGFIIVNYNSYNNYQLLKQSALTLKNNMRFAQSNSYSGEKPTSAAPSPAPIICTTLVGYTITFQALGYVLQPQCNPEGLKPAIISVTLPSGVTFAPVPAPLTFNALSRGTSLDSAVDIIFSGYSKQYTLEVSPGGDVSDKGFQSTHEVYPPKSP